ncbi:glycosyltransferase family 39 protein [Chroococcidiopsis sp. TS-821]|uniref:glycosyltransferase family 39 protein n=1 Tax=Chroococcidiopsis sp. TS-821 TaxID=1378066 RepID=UPI000CEF2CD6|nr:glycosyltransferase family 39 protein [Chroococcidiopsis sp. TS-821]PPS42788.1 hypothetical protein B1A85_13840 [Chroococcidiopsis sp. TS-821]
MSYPAVKMVAGKTLVKRTLKFEPSLVTILASFSLFAVMSWGKLADPIWDTGHEVEIPARILAGQVLYRDVETYYGPLAYYINAIALLLGHRIEVFYIAGLLLALIATLLVYTLAKRLTNQRWAMLCTLYVLIYCAFNPGGLLNFVVPYSYGVVYAIVLCLLAFIALDNYGKTGKVRWLIVAAIASGLAGLAKQEYGVAAVATMLIGIICTRQNLTKRLGDSLLIVVIAGLCAFIPLALLAKQASWENIFAALFPVAKSQVLTESGLFDVSLAKTLIEWQKSFVLFAVGLLIVITSTAIAHYLHQQQPNQWQKPVTFLASLAIAWSGLTVLRLGSLLNVYKVCLIVVFCAWISVIVTRWYFKLTNLKIIIQLLTIVVFFGLGLLLLRRFVCCTDAVFHPIGNLTWLLPAFVAWFAVQWTKIRQHYAPLLWALLIFSIVLNARFLFYINFYPLYAFTAVILFFTLLYHWARTSQLPIAKYIIICLIISGIIHLAQFTQYRYPISSDKGTLYIKDAELATAYNQAIATINAANAQSVLVIPEGSILNFLTTTSTPSKETIFIPGVLPNAAAEREFLARMRTNPPQLIVYVDVPFFWLREGYQRYRDYNPLVDRWIVQEHALIYASAPMTYFGEQWTLRIYQSLN